MTPPPTSTRYVPAAASARAGRMGLALSGGGFRAALFHLGALRRLNAAGLLARVSTIASVSGGSITSGVLARAWPALRPDASGVCAAFEPLVADPLRAFCAHDHRTGPLLTDRLNPLRWRGRRGGLASATDHLADDYAEALVPALTLAHLTRLHADHGVSFVFCSTNLATGVDFVFDAVRSGDYQTGYLHGRELRLADAIAASSAFPITFPPLQLRRSDFGAPSPQDAREAADEFFLTDGGVYDNLGLEPVWKDHEVVFCSDGGSMFRPDPHPGRWIVPRLLRSHEIMANQALAVRKRWLIASYVNKTYGGAYWGLGTDVDHYGVPGGAVPGFRGAALDALERVRTDLDAFTTDEQEALMAHGWCVANAALAAHAGVPLEAAPPGRGADFVADPQGTADALATSDRRFASSRGR